MRQVYGRCPYILVLIGHFIRMRIVLTIGTYDAIAVEIVIRWVIVVVITTITIFLLLTCSGHQRSCLLLIISQCSLGFKLRMLVQSLVNKVPNEAPLVDGIFANKLPIFGKVATRVAHGVVVFARNQRHVTLGIFCILLTLFHRIVHRAHDICGLSAPPKCLLILHRT